MTENEQGVAAERPKGGPGTMRLAVTMTPNPLVPGRVDGSFEIPQDISIAYVLWKKLGDAIFQLAMDRGEEPLVKPADQIGLAGLQRKMRG
jgi:hypothetical protein